jgi:sigma-B regulation protein RsbU (phosphoserine phosphatase)
MKYRWKLLLLMLVVSILPMVIMRTFGIHNVQTMANSLSDEVQANRLAAAENDTQSLLKSFSQALNTERERIAMALLPLGEFVRQAHTQHETMDRRLQLPAGPFPPPTAGKPPLSHLCVAAPDSTSAAHLQEARRIAQLESTFSAVLENLGDMILRQHAGFMSGVAAAYPCRRPGLHSKDVTAEAWYRNAFHESVHSWSRPYQEEQTRRWASSISLMVEDDDERPLGVVSVVVALDRLLERTLAFEDLPRGARAMLCMLEKQSASGEIGLRIFLETPVSPRTGPEWLKVPESESGQDVIQDIARRASRTVRMPADGQDAYWVYTPLPCQGTALVVIIPAGGLLQRAQPVQAAIKERLRRVEILTGGFLVLLAVVNAAVVFVFSRTVTRPLDALSKATNRLAAGDFEARVDIASKDEFGAMGAVFNRVGPQLKEHYRVREALQAAVEIQQSLLPRVAPRLPGLDIHAMSLYSEKVGGDYYDYLCVGEGGHQRLCVVVGDVSGHGISSAITMATARAFLRLRASLPGTLGEIVADVNRKFVEDVEYSGQFMTLFLARIDRASNRIEWVRAGHEPALLYDPRRETFQELAGAGVPLGVSESTRFAESAMPLEAGQVLVIGTDGIWEAQDAAGEMFGKSRLMQVIRQNAGLPAQAIAIAVLDGVEEFRGSDQQVDDITVMVIQVTDWDLNDGSAQRKENNENL